MPERIIRFDCLKCSKRYAVPASSAGTWLTCPCGRSTKVPRHSTVGEERQTPWDWLVGRFVYGLGGALFGLLVAAILARAALRRDTLHWLVAIPAVFFVLGLLGGEAFINWIGRRFNEDPR